MPSKKQEQLWDAARKRKSKDVRALLQERIDPEFYDSRATSLGLTTIWSRYYTPLMLAYNNNDYTTARLLLDAGSDVNHPLKYRLSIESADTLNPKMEIMEGSKRSMLLDALIKKNYDFVLLFLEADGVDVHYKPFKGDLTTSTPYEYAMREAPTYISKAFEAIQKRSLVQDEDENLRLRELFDEKKQSNQNQPQNEEKGLPPKKLVRQKPRKKNPFG